MKSYTVFLNGDRGWTDIGTEGFYFKVQNELAEQDLDINFTSLEEFEGELAKLNVGESYKVNVGKSEIEIKCEEIEEEKFKNLPEFSGW